MRFSGFFLQILGGIFRDSERMARHAGSLLTLAGGTGADLSSCASPSLPESHSSCRSVAEGDGTRQISALTIQGAGRK